MGNQGLGVNLKGVAEMGEIIIHRERRQGESADGNGVAESVNGRGCQGEWRRGRNRKGKSSAARMRGVVMGIIINRKRD